MTTNSKGRDHALAMARFDFKKVVVEERDHLDIGANDELAALCLSGGGIRSAAFAMGVLTGLAKQRALGGFHYLSTVSGGGYAGSWLSAWAARHDKGLDGVIAELDPVMGRDKPKSSESTDLIEAEPMFRESTDYREAEPIRFVRRYASFLSPRWGAVSVDTWTLFGIYVRNLLITGVVLVPLMAAALMPPRLNFAMVKAVAACVGSSGTVATQGCIVTPSSEVIQFTLLFVAGALLAITVATAHVQRVFRPEEAGAGIVGGDRGNRVDRNGTGDRESSDERGKDAMILGFFVLPGIFAFIVLTWLLAAVTPDTFDLVEWGIPTSVMPETSILVLWGMLATGAGTLLGFVLEAWSKFRESRAIARTDAGDSPKVEDAGKHSVTSEVLKGRGRRVGRLNLLAVRVVQFLSALVAGAVGGWFCNLVGERLLLTSSAETWVPESSFASHADLIAMAQATVGPLLLLSVGLMACTLFIGLGSRVTDSQDREIWARAGAWALIGMLVLAFFNTVALFGPIAVRAALGSLATSNLTLLLWGLISGLATAAAGMSPTGGGAGGGAPRQGLAKKIIDFVTAFAAPLFLLQVLLVVSIWNRWAVAGLELLLGDMLGAGAELEILLALIWMFALIVFMVVAGWFVDLNDFSLHGLYKIRLIRTFLGASRYRDDDEPRPNQNTGVDLHEDRRRPNPYTGFDLRDDMPMNSLLQPDKLRVRLFHVINMALNVGRGGDLALQYRKALPFTVSALHAGYGGEHYRRTGPLGSPDVVDSVIPHVTMWRRLWNTVVESLRWLRFGNSERAGPYFGGQISLGTAMTISGAAASPNMGYHSSPIVTFLLTLINARLGRWLGNTSDAGDGKFKAEHPGFSVRPIVGEAFGLTSTESPWVYLSDGGHFDNLGLYSMVARRCRYILVSDAGGDPTYSWNDLARAVQLIRIDFGIEITFDKPGEGASVHGGPGSVLVPEAAASVQGQPLRYRVGTIGYKARYGGEYEDGILIVLKPAVTEDDPVDIRNYRNRSKRFPHDSTIIQWYSEEQFEAYRKLGEETVCGLDVFCDCEDKSSRPRSVEMAAWFESLRSRILVGAKVIEARTGHEEVAEPTRP